MPMVGVNVDLWSLRARAPKLTRCVRQLINDNVVIQRPRQRRGCRAGWRVRQRRHAYAYADATATTDSEIGLLLKAKPIPVHVCFPRRGARRPVRRSRVLTTCTDAVHLTSRGNSDDSDIQVIALTKPKQPEIHNCARHPLLLTHKVGLPRRSFL